MLGANLMLLVSLGQVQQAGPDRDPAALVVQLGAARYADRQAAAAALERIGRPALPALRTARDSRDLEVRNRAWSVTQKIEGALLTLPTRIRLDFDDTPLFDVTKALSLQAGFKMALYPPNLTKWRLQRVTLHGSQPVDFWKAVDQLCDAAGLQYNSSMHGFGGERDPIFTLTDGSQRALTPISDHGPFRVSLLGVDYHRNLIYAPQSGAIGNLTPPRPRPAALEPGPRDAGSPPRLRPVTNEPAPRDPALAPRLNPRTNVQFTAQLVVAAEPRLTLTYQHGSLQLIEAVDERGNSLIPAGKSGQVSRTAAYFGIMSGPVVQIPAPLHRPAVPGESIKKLRGIIPLTVSSRRPDPLIVPLTNSAGKTFENPDLQLTVHEIRPMLNTRNTLVELSLRPSDRDALSSPDDADGFNNLMQRPDPSQLQIEVTDTRGQMIPWFQSGADAETSRVTLTLTNPATELKELRYYTLTRSSVNVPFEFTDIPMP
ncbi:MAG: hypothetical protein ACHRXM_05905 [Isosphaerales bacterium]